MDAESVPAEPTIYQIGLVLPPGARVTGFAATALYFDAEGVNKIARAWQQDENGEGTSLVGAIEVLKATVVQKSGYLL